MQREREPSSRPPFLVAAINTSQPPKVLWEYFYMPLRAEEAAAVVELVNVFQSVSVYMRARIIRTSVRVIPQRAPLSVPSVRACSL